MIRWVLTNSNLRNHPYRQRGRKIFLVEDLTLREPVGIFPLSRDLAGSKPALISKLDARPGVIEGRLRVEEKIVEWKPPMKVRSLWFLKLLLAP